MRLSRGACTLRATPPLVRWTGRHAACYREAFHVTTTCRNSHLTLSHLPSSAAV